MTKQNKNLLYIGLAAAAFLYWNKNKKSEKKSDSSSEGGSGSGVPSNSTPPEVTLISTKIPEIYNVSY